ncbi:MAG TPA: bifunctional phosphoribosylaminoimidazolecarboxamide formyltransferase/IMP cyclohydrolase [Gemmatimonadales bacterium]|nr:bifunctional phosphoribosylaminoimidazolecarboxamide formyltransferase/IMP cyclohydrolase [Gemmatimonadales bacterium]
MPRALLSVSNKSGLVPFARGLAELGWELVSTGGTARALREAGLDVQDVSEITGFPEIMDGRVKTLHPAVHGGLLARRDLPEHMSTIAEHEIAPIDLVAVNLYPFRETVAREGVTAADAIEQIDIGGPSMLRSAAKNFAGVWVVVNPEDYERVLNAIRQQDEGSDTNTELRRELASHVFSHTASYDAAIAGWFASERDERFPESVTITVERQQSLRYGENPGQAAAFYRERTGGLDALEQLGGKELSFNNILDLEGALLATDHYADEMACAIVKHTTPCGIGVGESPLKAYHKALACDPASAFGSVISLTRAVDTETAEAISALFVECLVAPDFEADALEILRRKKNLRILRGKAEWYPGEMDVKRVRGGLLLQERAPAAVDEVGWKVVTTRQPTASEFADLRFAWKAVASVKSNAIVLARDGATIGIGAGQMSRVDASFLAAHKARGVGHETGGSALGSDAFFPFRDGVDQAAEAGVTAVIQPGGSVRDEEVIAAAEEHGIAMVFTGQRQFRH